MNFPAELAVQFERASVDYCLDWLQADVDCDIDLPAAEDHASDSESESESSSGEGEVEVNVSLREEDEIEERVVDDFMAKGCGCRLGPNKSSCSKLFSRTELSTTRLNCLEMSTAELDMLVLANLDAHRRNESSAVCTSTLSIPNDEHKARDPIDYYFRGKHVCKGTFFFVQG